jgi:beta-glucosidase
MPGAVGGAAAGRVTDMHAGLPLRGCSNPDRQGAGEIEVEGGETMTTEADIEAGTSAADVRAREVEEQLTDEERFSLILGVMGQLPGFVAERDERIPEGTKMSAAYTPGVPRLGVPALQMSDASMGVTNPGYANREGDTATAMPACIALGASFNPALARASG